MAVRRGDELEEAATAAREGRPEDALGHLLATWRVTPARAIADAVEAVGRHVDATHPPVGGKTARERAARWLALADQARPAALGTLLAGIVEKRGNALTVERLERLRPQARDPRFTTLLLGWFEKPPYSAGFDRTRNFWELVFELLVEIGDPRVLDAARELPARWAANSEVTVWERGYFNGRLERLLPRLETRYAAGLPSLTAAEARLCEEAARAVSGAAARDPRRAALHTEAELLREVYLHPDEDGPRLVYGDWLQERGDPRGELIALQFLRRDGRIDAGQQRREKALLAEHQRRWMGAIEPHVRKTGVTFERGFLAACKATALDDSWEWATVRQLEGVVPHSDELHLPSLRVLSSPRPAWGEADAVLGMASLRRPLAVEELHWHGLSPRRGGQGQIDFIGAETFARITVLSLRRMTMATSDCWREPGLVPAAFDWIWASPATRSLEELRLYARLDALEAWRREGERRGLHRLTLDAVGLVVGSNACWTLELLRDGGGHLTRLRVTSPARPAESWFAALLEAIAVAAPGTLTSIDLVPSARWKPSKEEQAAVAGLAPPGGP